MQEHAPRNPSGIIWRVIEQLVRQKNENKLSVIKNNARLEDL